MLLLPGVGHGPMHVNTGGVFGECEQQFDDFYAQYHDYLAMNVTIGPGEEVMADDFKIPDYAAMDDDKTPYVDYEVYSKLSLFQDKVRCLESGLGLE